MTYETLRVEREDHLTILTLDRPDALNALSRRMAAELLLTGDFIHAERARETGLVSQVVPDAELLATARDTARRMLRNSPLALRLTKDCLKANIDAGSLESAIAMEDRNQVLTARSSDFREGIAAFLEKREPKFKDR